MDNKLKIFDFENVPLRSLKAGRFGRVSLTSNSHPIVTRGSRVSRAPPRQPSEEASPLFYIFMVLNLLRGVIMPLFLTRY